MIAAWRSQCGETFQSHGHKAAVFPADVSQLAELRGIVPAVLAELGSVDILVNFAGVNRRKAATDISEEDWDTIHDTNLKGVFFLCQEVGRYWIQSKKFSGQNRSGKGKIINIGSLTSAIGVRDIAAYAATKTGILGITRSLALEWATNGICVNAMSPGYFETRLTKVLFDDPIRAAWIHSRIPMGYHGLPPDLVGTAIFLSSSASDYITGQNISVDGGWLAA